MEAADRASDDSYRRVLMAHLVCLHVGCDLRGWEPLLLVLLGMQLRVGHTRCPPSSLLFFAVMVLGSMPLPDAAAVIVVHPS